MPKSVKFSNIVKVKIVPYENRSTDLRYLGEKMYSVYKYSNLIAVMINKYDTPFKIVRIEGEEDELPIKIIDADKDWYNDISPIVVHKYFVENENLEQEFVDEFFSIMSSLKLAKNETFSIIYNSSIFKISIYIPHLFHVDPCSCHQHM